MMNSNILVHVIKSKQVFLSPNFDHSLGIMEIKLLDQISAEDYNSKFCRKVNGKFEIDFSNSSSQFIFDFERGQEICIDFTMIFFL